MTCWSGYCSSLVAVSLQALGRHQATDVAGGFRAWRAAGLPVAVPPATKPAAAAVTVVMTGMDKGEVND